MKLEDIKMATYDFDKDINCLMDGLTEIRKLEDQKEKDIWQERQKKEEILGQLAMVRNDLSATLRQEKAKCTEALSKLGEEILITIIPYVASMEAKDFNDKGNLRTADKMSITEIRIDEELICENKNNKPLFAFLNGDWQTAIEAGEIFNIDANSDKTLAEISSTISGKSLFELKLEAMQLGTYYNYLQEIMVSLCDKYGHDWQLRYTIEKNLPDGLEIRAHYVCKLCQKKMQEKFKHADEVTYLPDVLTRWSQCNPNMELPSLDLEKFNNNNTNDQKRKLKFPNKR